MKLLLDTCTFLWIISEPGKISQQALTLFKDMENDVFLSVVSTWEISIKYHLGKLPLPDAPETFLPVQRESHFIESLPLNEESTLQLPRLPDLHNDPFDRMLICQAITHGLTLLTPDLLIRQYPVRTKW